MRKITAIIFLPVFIACLCGLCFVVPVYADNDSYNTTQEERTVEFPEHSNASFHAGGEHTNVSDTDTNSSVSQTSGKTSTSGGASGHTSTYIPPAYQKATQAKSNIKNNLKELVDQAGHDPKAATVTWSNDGRDMVAMAPVKMTAETFMELLGDLVDLGEAYGTQYLVDSDNLSMYRDAVKYLDEANPLVPSQHEVTPESSKEGSEAGEEMDQDRASNGGIPKEVVNKIPMEVFLDQSEFTLEEIQALLQQYLDKKEAARMYTYLLGFFDDNGRGASSITNDNNTPNITMTSANLNPSAQGNVRGIRPDLVAGGMRGSTSYLGRFEGLISFFSSYAARDYMYLSYVEDYHLDSVSNVDYEELNYTSDERQWVLKNSLTGEEIVLKTTNPQHELKLMNLQKGNYMLTATQPATCIQKQTVYYHKYVYLVDPTTRNVLYFRESKGSQVLKSSRQDKQIPVGDVLYLNVLANGEVTEGVHENLTERVE